MNLLANSEVKDCSNREQIPETVCSIYIHCGTELTGNALIYKIVSDQMSCSLILDIGVKQKINLQILSRVQKLKNLSKNINLLYAFPNPPMSLKAPRIKDMVI